MSFFISNAFASTASGTHAATSSSSITSLLFVVVFFGIFYFLVLRPQNKRQKEKNNMINNLARGDEVITSGGLLGKITHIDESFLELEVATDVKIKVQRQAIAANLPKGTVK